MDTLLLFKCNEIDEYETTFNYKFVAVTTGNDNKAFWKYTSNGDLRVGVTKEQGKLFEVGKNYHIRVSEVI